MAKATNLKKLCRVLRQGRNFLICAHVEPEGDAGGSALALNSLLRRLGKKSRVICDDPVPKQLSFLDVEWHSSRKALGDSRVDYLISLDTPTKDRVGWIWNHLDSKVKVVNIDHHISNTLFGDINYVDPHSAACGEIVFDIFQALEIPIAKQNAVLLYIAISTDTGSFRYSNTTSRTHQIVAKLIGRGIDVGELNDRLYSIYNVPQLKLFGKLLSQIQVNRRKRIAWVVLSEKLLKETKTTVESASGFIDFLKYLEGVEAVFVVIHERPGRCKVSFRSKGDYDVNRLAQAFGGGGHRKASGCTIAASTEQVVREILRRI